MKQNHLNNNIIKNEYINEYNNFLADAEKVLNIIMFKTNDTFDTFDTNIYNFDNSPIKILVGFDVNDKNYTGYEQTILNIDYLPRFQKDILRNKEIELRNIYDKYFVITYEEKEIFLTCAISMFLLNRLYICFNNPNKNGELIRRLYTFFDKTDVSGNEKRILTECSSLKDIENYLKIKFTWLLNSYSIYISNKFNLKRLNSNSIFLDSKYLQISTYDDEQQKIPFKVNDYYFDLFSVNSCIYGRYWFYTILLIFNKNNYNICVNCHKLFVRYSSRLSNVCENCANDGVYDIDNDRKNREHDMNRDKIKYIEKNYLKVEDLLDDNWLKKIENILTNKQTSIRHGNNLNEVYNYVVAKIEEKYPPTKTIKKGSLTM